MRDAVAELFGTGRNFAALATVMDDGSPHAVSIWSGVEGDRIVFFTSPASRKGRNIARDPRVALTVVDGENPYRTARVRGEVVETFDGDRAMEIVDRMSERYTGRPFPMRDSTVYVVEVAHEEFEELPFDP
ncbi:MAG: class F420-dependent oxidoreductase [Solirubrobacterales bacterium]|nr:class F420-dependent oxidoreductase [Solirubrobacterales bacterium]